MRRSGKIRVGAVRVEAHYLWFAREELRLYRPRKRELASLEAGHAWSRPDMAEGMPRGSTPGNPTASRAASMSADLELQAKRSSVEWIERILPTLEPRTRKVLTMLVMDGHYTAEGAAMKLSEEGDEITSRTVYRARDEGLLALAIAWFGEWIAKKPPQKGGKNRARG